MNCLKLIVKCFVIDPTTGEAIIAFCENFICDTFYNASQEACTLLKTRHRMHLVCQKPQKLKKIQVNFSGISSVYTLTDSIVGYHSSTFCANCDSKQERSSMNSNQLLTDIKKTCTSSLQCMPPVIQGQNRLQHNSSLNNYERYVDHLQQVDVHQLSKTNENLLHSAISLDLKAQQDLKSSNIDQSDNYDDVNAKCIYKSNVKVQDYLPNSAFLLPSLMSALKVNESLGREGNQLCRCHIRDKTDMSTLSGNLLSNTLDAHSSVYMNEQIIVEEIEQLRCSNRTVPTDHSSQSQKTLYSLQTSKSHEGFSNAVPRACLWQSRTNMCSNVYNNAAAEPCFEYRLAANIMHSAVIDILKLKNCIRTQKCLDLGLSTCVKKYLNVIWNNILNEVIDDVAFKCKHDFVEQLELKVAADVTVDSIQSFADKFVCFVFKDVIHTKKCEQDAGALLSIGELHDGWMRPLENIQRNFVFFDMEFGRRSAGGTERMDISVDSFSQRRRNSSNGWHKQYRCGSSSFGTNFCRVILLDFENELKRNVNKMDMSRPVNNLNGFQKHLQFTAYCGGPNKFSENFKVVASQSNTTIASLCSHLDSSCKAVDKLSTHKLAWKLVAMAFMSALKSVTSIYECSSTAADTIITTNQFLQLPSVQSDSGICCAHQEKRMINACVQVAKRLYPNIMTDALLEFSDLSELYRMSKLTVKRVSVEILQRLADDAAVRVVKEASCLAAAALNRNILANPKGFGKNSTVTGSR